jgi:hypothetical protein
MNKDSILKKYPKQRIDLPKEFKQIYNKHYFQNREGKYKTTSISQKLESWMHKKIAEDVLKDSTKITLEIGAGTLNQLQYENNQNIYDIVEPFRELYKDSNQLIRIRNIYSDIKEIKGIKYDRITSIATFEHLLNLPDIVAKAVTLLKLEGGQLRVAIPNEGTFLWKLGTFVTGYEFKKKYNLDYQTLMRYEHVNTADDIEEVLNYFFKEVKCSVFGISKNLAFYRFYVCKFPVFEIAKKHMENNSLNNEI